MAKNITIVLVLLLIVLIVFFVLSRIEIANRIKEFKGYISQTEIRINKLLAESKDNLATIRQLAALNERGASTIRKLDSTIQQLKRNERKREKIYSRLGSENKGFREQLERAANYNREASEIVDRLISGG